MFTDSPRGFVLFLTFFHLLKRPSLEDVLQSYPLMMLIAVLAGDALSMAINRWTSYKIRGDLFSTIFMSVLGLAICLVFASAFYESMLEFLQWKHQSDLHWFLNLLVVCIKTITMRIIQIPFV